MIQTLKRIFSEYKSLFKGAATAIVVILIYDFIIAPGLTAKNTVINVFSFLGGAVLMFISAILIWENLFPSQKKNETWQETQDSVTTSKEDSEN